MNRRDCVMALIALGVAPARAHAQPSTKVWRVGVLWPGASSPNPRLEAFRHALRDLGYIEGRNLVIVYGYAEGNYERLPELARTLVRQKVHVIVGAGAPAITAARSATSTIPIVIATAGDPVGAGFARTLAQPGGNITGLSDLSSDLGAKLLELLLVAVPKLSNVGVLTNPGNSSHDSLRASIDAAAQRAGVKVSHVKAQSPQQIENAFRRWLRQMQGR
jgi:putative tryptophan/tyrosine transport system substrate-binding protein